MALRTSSLCVLLVLTTSLLLLSGQFGLVLGNDDIKIKQINSANVGWRAGKVKRFDGITKADFQRMIGNINDSAVYRSVAQFIGTVKSRLTDFTKKMTSQLKDTTNKVINNGKKLADTIKGGNKRVVTTSNKKVFNTRPTTSNRKKQTTTTKPVFRRTTQRITTQRAAPQRRTTNIQQRRTTNSQKRNTQKRTTPQRRSTNIQQRRPVQRKRVVPQQRRPVQQKRVATRQPVRRITTTQKRTTQQIRTTPQRKSTNIQQRRPVQRKRVVPQQRRANNGASVLSIEEGGALTLGSGGGLPSSFDARKQWPNCPITIRQQGRCGSCYAFASAGFLAHRLCVATGGSTNPVLSPDFIVRCNAKTKKCDGGTFTNVFDQLVSVGMPSEKCVRYASADRFVRSCPSKCDDGSSFSFYKAVPGTSEFLSYQKEDEIKRSIMTDGAIGGYMIVYDEFRHYESGVYSLVNGNKADFIGLHAIQYIGWGEEGGMKYWLCVNSWGTDWGENGYFKLLMGAPGKSASVFAGAHVFKAAV